MLGDQTDQVLVPPRTTMSCGRSLTLV
jgi:hypothetical protein